MTDRHRGYVVVLENDIREDDAEAVINAMRMIKGVLTVKPIIADAASMIERERVKVEYNLKLHEALTAVLK